MKMRRAWRFLRALALALAAAGAMGAPARAGGPDTLNVGFVGDFSGARGAAAQDALDGFKLAVKHLGGRLGGAEFILTVMDDKDDSEAARRATERLIRDERTQVVLTSTGPRGTALAAAAGAVGHAFVVSLSSPAPAQAGKDCSPYFFSLTDLYEAQHEFSGQYMQGQGYRTVLLAGEDIPSQRAAAEAFRRGYKGQVEELWSKRGEMDFARAEESIRRRHPDAVYLLQTGGMAVNFLLQWQDHKLKGEVPLYGPPTTLDQTVIAAVGQPAVGLFSIGPWSEDLDNPSNRRLMSDFEGEYGRPVSFHAAIGYDAAMLLDAAFRQVGDKKFNDDEALRTALRSVEFASTRGNLHFDTNHFPIQSYVLREVVEVVKDVRGHFANEQRGVVIRDSRDVRALECPMRWTPAPPPPIPKS